MSLAKYPEYKSSGADWIGDVPIHWVIKPLKRGLSLITNKAESASNPVGLENIESWSGKWVDSETEFQGQGIEFSVGDVLFGKLRPYLAKALLAESAGEAIGDFHVLRPAQDVEGKFALYCILRHGFISTVSGAAYGSKMPRVGWEFLSTLPFPVPAPHEQRAIAYFLDHETAKIDALVEEQKRLIKLLKEKRQAVISQAVTKGLDPNAPMKDSGVEWLEDVPAHWRVIHLRRIIDKVEQGWSPECVGTPASNECWGVLKAGAVNGGIFREEENKELPASFEARPNLEVQPGDLLMSRASGSPNLIGSVAYVQSTRPKLMISDKLFRLLPTRDALPEYIAIMMGSPPLRVQIEMSIGGAEGLANNLSQASIRALTVAMPTVDEQKEIINAVKENSFRLNNLLFVAKQAIELLHERRSALISAAVTGKIDVRNWKAPEAATTEDQLEPKRAAS